MKVFFHLGWQESSKSSKKSFKSQPALELFSEYLERIRKFTPAEAASALTPDFRKQNPQAFLLLCDFHKGSRMLSSEELAAQADKVLQGGYKSMNIAIGRADGFTAEEKKDLRPDLIWSFGPMTLPHELAAVVAAEQIYRAWTILKKHPYHLGHVI